LFAIYGSLLVVYIPLILTAVFIFALFFRYSYLWVIRDLRNYREYKKLSPSEAKELRTNKYKQWLIESHPGMSDGWVRGLHRYLVVRWIGGSPIKDLFGVPLLRILPKSILFYIVTMLVTAVFVVFISMVTVSSYVEREYNNKIDIVALQDAPTSTGHIEVFLGFSGGDINASMTYYYAVSTEEGLKTISLTHDNVYIVPVPGQTNAYLVETGTERMHVYKDHRSPWLYDLGFRGLDGERLTSEEKYTFYLPPNSVNYNFKVDMQ